MLEGVEAEEGAAEVEERQVNGGAADPASACRHGAAAATAARSHHPTDSQNVADSGAEVLLSVSLLKNEERFCYFNFDIGFATHG